MLDTAGASFQRAVPLLGLITQMLSKQRASPRVSALSSLDAAERDPGRCSALRQYLTRIYCALLMYSYQPAADVAAGLAMKIFYRASMPPLTSSSKMRLKVFRDGLSSATLISFATINYLRFEAMPTPIIRRLVIGSAFISGAEAAQMVCPNTNVSV